MRLKSNRDVKVTKELFIKSLLSGQTQASWFKDEFESI